MQGALFFYYHEMHESHESHESHELKMASLIQHSREFATVSIKFAINCDSDQGTAAAEKVLVQF